MNASPYDDEMNTSSSKLIATTLRGVVASVVLVMGSFAFSSPASADTIETPGATTLTIIQSTGLAEPTVGEICAGATKKWTHVDGLSYMDLGECGSLAECNEKAWKLNRENVIAQAAAVCGYSREHPDDHGKHLFWVVETPKDTNAVRSSDPTDDGHPLLYLPDGYIPDGGCIPGWG